MEFKQLLSQLNEDYFLNINIILEQKIAYLYDNIDCEIDDFKEQIIFDIFRKSNPLFKRRALLEFVTAKISESEKESLNVLCIANDSGQFAASLALLLKEHDLLPKKVNLFFLNNSFKLLRNFTKGHYKHEDLILANVNDLDFFDNKVSYYQLNNDIIQLINPVNATLSMPFLSDIFDMCIMDEKLSHFGEKHHKTIIDELFRILKPKGKFFTPEKNVRYFINTLFDYKISEEKVYFIKEGGLPSSKINEFSLKKAIGLFHDKKYDDALIITHHLMSQNLNREQSIEIYRLLFVIYSRQDDIHKINYLMKIIQAEGIFDPDIDFIIGSYFFNKMDYSIALGYFKSAVEKKDKFCYAIYYIGLIYGKMGKISKAKGYFEDAYDKIKAGEVYDPQLFADSISYEMIEFLLENELN